MKRALKLFAILLVCIVAICGYSFLTDKTDYTKWVITKESNDSSEISWTKFIWSSDTISGKYYEKTSMQIPFKIEGLPYNFTFQFDLGAPLTGFYEYNLSSFYEINSDLKNRISRLRSPLQFWYNKKGFKDLTIEFGNYKIANRISYFYNDYGEKLNIDKTSLNDTFHIGTIGADIFQNKVLIIDYPNQRFAICDTIPSIYQGYLSNMELTNAGMAILSYNSKGGNYKITFDNGSSLFPIITRTINRPKFSKNPIIDSLNISSWGEKHIVDSRLITDSFELAGKTYCNVKVYENHTDKGIDINTDGMAGNYLFWNNTIIIDYKNKKFGVK